MTLDRTVKNTVACPVCGVKPEMQVWKTGMPGKGYVEYRVMCQTLFCDGGRKTFLSAKMRKTKEDAIKDWEHRVQCLTNL